VPRVLTARFMHETDNPGALVESATVTLHLLRFAPDRARGARTGTESLQTLRWRGESGANQSLKWGFFGPGNYGSIPRRLWMMLEA
jgi:hypothetical protein